MRMYKVEGEDKDLFGLVVSSVESIGSTLAGRRCFLDELCDDTDERLPQLLEDEGERVSCGN